jgi:putative DNA primase/helicase
MKRRQFSQEERHVTLDDALHFCRAGLSVLPVRADGSKQPDGPWKQYQITAATEEVVRYWFAQGRDGIGAVMGAISGYLELFEFDDLDTYRVYKGAAAAAGLGALVERIERGYSEATPGDGIHWYFRCCQISGNTKLAQRPAPTVGNAHAVKVLIETRGEGGYAVLAPSGGRTHPTGHPYHMLDGDVATIATITADERRDLWTLARTFDETPIKDERLTPSEQRSRRAEGAVRPGDHFNARSGWTEILEPHGWVHVYRQGHTDFWRRPGKERGVSATTNHTGRDSLMIFSTSTPFEIVPSSYDKFGAYAVLRHNGDFSAAANALRLRGFGWS